MTSFSLIFLQFPNKENRCFGSQIWTEFSDFSQICSVAEIDESINKINNESWETRVEIEKEFKKSFQNSCFPVLKIDFGSRKEAKFYFSFFFYTKNIHNSSEKESEKNEKN